ncbi:hypothetical protein G6F64_014013 [Rhizopus arrhizus]|uniref:Uncharacterized protein n=1 Tax=Rhizopus oryzae TaxID=64495 RepID=A0A9P7BK77_RHIOR|nr:hypothetical protein G6F64_014013 [Rhizopus arrhizus]
MERPHFVAAAGASFREHAHRLAFAQAVGHHLHHPTERFGVAALVEDGLATCCQPTDQRPAGDLALGDEAHHALAVKEADVDPADVTTALPASSAAHTMLTDNASGKLKGAMTANTP